MTKKGKRKAKIVDYDSDVEISLTPRVEIIYEDTKLVIGAEPEFKWCRIYHMLKEKKVPEGGLEELLLYDNILKYGITKVSTRAYIFPFLEVIGWILSKVDAMGMIVYNVEDNRFSSFTPPFVAKAYNLPPSEVSMTTD